MKDAMRQLQRLRRVDGQQGEGLREFSALVTETYEKTAHPTQERITEAELPPLDFLAGAA